jgi:endonuclease-3 related protein
MFIDSFDFFRFLHQKVRLDTSRGEWWWPNAGTFEVAVGALLTQQTKWQNVEISLTNLKENSLLDLDSLSGIDEFMLQGLIKPSGFYKQKSKRLKLLCQNIKEEFGDFESFKYSVNREWLLNQKGIGKESADSILNYGCFKEYMVVDNYTKKILKGFGYEFESYEETQEWLTNGIEANYDKVCSLYNKELPLSLIYAKFHAKIVEYGKRGL